MDDRGLRVGAAARRHHPRPRRHIRRTPVVTPVATGVLAFGTFYGLALIAKRIPFLESAIGNVLRFADEGELPLVVLTTCANGVGEELFFRGALFSVLRDEQPVLRSTAVYTAATLATRNPALVAAAAVMGTLFGLQRKASGGVQAPCSHPPDLVGAHAALPPAAVRVGHRRRAAAHRAVTGAPGTTVERPSIVWFRRDLRLRDHAALLTAPSRAGARALRPRRRAAAHRRRPSHGLAAAQPQVPRRRPARARGGLVVRRGRPADVVPGVVAETGATAVHVSADFTPYGARRDARRRGRARRAARLTRAGAHRQPVRRRAGPGGARRRGAVPGLHAVLPLLARPRLAPSGGVRPGRDDLGHRGGRRIPDDPDLGDGTTLPEPGEAGAAAAWRRFREEGLAGYDTDRDRPDHDATSRMSPHLKIGTVHPRTLLADLGHSTGEDAYRRQLAWRDFYATVLHFWPRSAHGYFRRAFESMEYDTGPEAQDRFRAWQEGRTGFPYVDAGMRQLLAEGWMHNRLRMLVASFLVKDLHLEWTLGRGTSWTTSSTATWPTTSTAGSGPRGPAPTRRRTSASSTR